MPNILRHFKSLKVLLVHSVDFEQDEDEPFRTFDADFRTMQQWATLCPSLLYCTLPLSNYHSDCKIRCIHTDSYAMLQLIPAGSDTRPTRFLSPTSSPRIPFRAHIPLSGCMMYSLARATNLLRRLYDNS